MPPAPQLDTFAARLAYWMAERGLNNTQLARAAKVSRTSVVQWLHGDTEPEFESVKKVAAALDVQVADLTGDAPPPALPAVTKPEELLGWFTGRQTELARALNRQLESVINAEVERRLAAADQRLHDQGRVITVSAGGGKTEAITLLALMATASSRGYPVKAEDVPEAWLRESTARYDPHQGKIRQRLAKRARDLDQHAKDTR